MVAIITILAISNVSLAAYLYWACHKFDQITNRYKDAFKGYDAVIQDYKLRLEIREKVIVEQGQELLSEIHLN